MKKLAVVQFLIVQFLSWKALAQESLNLEKALQLVIKAPLSSRRRAEEDLKKHMTRLHVAGVACKIKHAARGTWCKRMEK